MKTNVGGTRLFGKSQWCAPETLCGTEMDILEHPSMAEAFERILRDFEPKHRNAVFSLCTKTRPYSRTLVWKNLKQVCEGYADPIVVSNGGIIPIEYEREWPFMTYDAAVGDHRYDKPAAEKLEWRLRRFFECFEYTQAVFVLMPHYRYRASAITACSSIKMPYRLIPGRFLWSRLNEQVPTRNGAGKTSRYKSDGFTWYPLAHPSVIATVAKAIGRESAQ